jgi:hypothetical protein
MDADVLFKIVCSWYVGSVDPIRQTDTCDTFVKGKTDYQVYLPVMTTTKGRVRYCIATEEGLSVSLFLYSVQQ